ncbi:MaoC/PaaZ C-terminal domain-containing protein [Cellulomonas alba]|uniref:MaoC/PaaZ C-terminal domain-containing protein n=1 Tax=Cellulomonas alba TaxID=3053467 RepID=A0ABT7SEL1_9CELL|nr:MaoC/PaaZ C-terminal domain-containing protein [Cellulomonas alba]MDM7854610.1 MaoC/PaaZ C-terminal domain-containing protein [Cellulomonas alba]
MTAAVPPTGDGLGDRRVVTLPAVPALGGLYVKGLAGVATSVVGRRLGRGSGALPDVAYEVAGVRADAARLTAYQHLVGESASDALPAGFVHVLAFPLAVAVMTTPGFPFPLVGAVHVANRVEQHREARLDEPLTLRAWSQGLRSHRAGTQAELVVTASDADGERVWTGVSTYLAKGVHLTDRPGPADDPAEERTPFVAPVPTGRWQLPADEGRLYAAVSGDRNPIHVSSLAAKGFGFPRAIAHGMDTAARALAAVGAAHGPAFVWTAEFARPVLLPGSPAVRVARDVDGFAYAVWDARSGKPHLTGTVRPV